MPYTISIPERKTFRLERLDAKHEIPEEDQTTVTIRQATVRQNTERSKLFEELIQEISVDGKERRIIKWHTYTLMTKEVYLTLCESNIRMGDKPLFKTRQTADGPALDMRFDEFERTWGMLPDEIAIEIHEKVLEVNPHWILGTTYGTADLGED